MWDHWKVLSLLIVVYGNSKSLARALRALEYSEVSENKIMLDLEGSLNKPCKAGSRYGYRDKRRDLADEKKQAYPRLQGLSFKLLSDPLQIHNLTVFMSRSSLRTL